MGALHLRVGKRTVCVSTKGTVQIEGKSGQMAWLRDLIGPPDLDWMGEYSFDLLESPKAQRAIRAWASGR